ARSASPVLRDAPPRLLAPAGVGSSGRLTTTAPMTRARTEDRFRVERSGAWKSWVKLIDFGTDLHRLTIANVDAFAQRISANVPPRDSIEDVRRAPTDPNGHLDAETAAQ